MLGQYILQTGAAGTDDSLCRGDGYNGMQSDFVSAVREFVNSGPVLALGYQINMGYSGYVSLDTAKEWAKNGNLPFRQEIAKFGWGVGWEIEKVLRVGVRGKTIDCSTLENEPMFQQALADAGLKLKNVYINGSLALSYLYPSDIIYSTDVDGVEYDPNKSGGSTASGGSTSESSGSASLSSAAYFFANQFNSVTDMSQSYMLQGTRALANDEPLWNYVKKAINASLRACSSDPDGNFIAWYPDYYGKYGNTPKTTIDLVELQDLTITQSDKEFYSHVFCPGVNLDGSEITMMYTQGVVSIETDDAAVASGAAATTEADSFELPPVAESVSPILQKMIYIPEGDEWKYTPKELYRRYGARPAKTQSLPNFARGVLREDPSESQNAERANQEGEESTPELILPYLYALYEFMYHWANQYQAKIQVTFMPEVFPGSRVQVNLPSGKNIAFYVQGVTHNMSYTQGFTTTLNCICPVGNLVSGMVM